jgi:hypothetical protein
VHETRIHSLIESAPNSVKIAYLRQGRALDSYLLVVEYFAPYNRSSTENKNLINKGGRTLNLDSRLLRLEDHMITPLELLRESIKAVPAVKYALGVAGIASAIAIVRTLNLDYRVATLGTIVMLLLMTTLIVFARLTSLASPDFRLPALVFTWFSLLLVIAISVAMFTSVFFRWPLNLQNWVMSDDFLASTTGRRPLSKGDTQTATSAAESKDTRKEEMHSATSSTSSSQMKLKTESLLDQKSKAQQKDRAPTTESIQITPRSATTIPTAKMGELLDQVMEDQTGITLRKDPDTGDMYVQYKQRFQGEMFDVGQDVGKDRKMGRARLYQGGEYWELIYRDGNRQSRGSRGEPENACSMQRIDGLVQKLVANYGAPSNLIGPTRTNQTPNLCRNSSNCTGTTENIKSEYFWRFHDSSRAILRFMYWDSRATHLNTLGDAREVRTGCNVELCVLPANGSSCFE